MGNCSTKNRKKNIPAAQMKKESTLSEDILTIQTGRQDFSTAQIPVEDIIIKCNLEEMTKSFFQDYVIVWHDPNVNSQENQQYIVQLKRFCEVFIFTEWQKARDFIQTTPAACHVVTSGTNGELLVKEVNQLQSVANIYIFCGNKDYHSNWAKIYQKVSCIETNIDSVLSQIQSNLLEWYKQASSLKLSLPAFAPIFNDTDKSQMNNLHRFLKVIPNFQNRLQAKNDFLNLSKAVYSDPKLITDFEQNYNAYDKGQTLRWYTQESFLYKVTNNCLRIATSDSIQYCRLLLQDIQRAIKEHYQTKSKHFSGLLYRGAYLSQEEWLSLKSNLNREIEMHGFLSVSKVKNIGLNFMKADPSKKVFITIIVPKGPNEEEQGFAEVEEFSQFPQEKEILFNVRSRFTILETEDEGPYRHLVLLYGAQGFRKFLVEQKPILEVSILKWKNALCSQCKVERNDKMFFISLRDPQKQIYYCEECVNSDHAPFLCLPPSKKDGPFIARISGCLLKNSQKTELPFYGYKCSSQECQAEKQKRYFTCTDCHEIWCQNCFENSHNCTHNIILETFPFTFWSQKMSLTEFTHVTFQDYFITNSSEMFQQAEMYTETLLNEKAVEYYLTYIQRNETKGQDSNLAICYHNLGGVFHNQGEYSKALEYTFKALNIFRLVYGGNHPHIAFTYNSIGSIFFSQGEYEKALEYFLKCLDVNKSVYGEKHPQIATSYQNLGHFYYNQGDDKKALEYYSKSLEINELFYGKIHPNVANSYLCIGTVKNHEEKYKEALEHFFKALDIQKSIYGENHFEIATTYHNIGIAFHRQEEDSKALEYYLKSLDISKLVYGDNHPKMVDALNNIGLLFTNQGEYEKALECFLKSLAISKQFHELNHPNVAVSYHHIGLLYHQQGEYSEALEYYSKALELLKSVHGENHPSVATSYDDIGQVYSDQGEYSKALEYELKSLEINKSLLGENDPRVGSAYFRLASLYHHPKDYEKALKYSFKCLDSHKSLYGEKHRFVATLCHFIGTIFHEQTEFTKALGYYLKSLEISKALYGEKHPMVASAYHFVGSVFHQQGEFTKTLEYEFKSLEVNKSLYGDKDQIIAATYHFIGGVFHQQGEFTKALEYYLKSLDIYKSVCGDNHPQTIETQNRILEIQSMNQNR